MKNYIQHHPWEIIEDGFHAEYNKISESIFSLGNGKIGQRGNFEEYFSGETLQGNYISGIYYPDKTRVGWWKNGYPEYFAKVLNAPDWTGIKIKIDNIPLDPSKLEISHFKRSLNMKHGYFEKKYTIHLDKQKKIDICSIRFLCVQNDEIGAIRFTLTPNFSGTIQIESSLNADVRNEDANYDEMFWLEIEKSSDISHTYIVSETKKTHFRVCHSIHTHISIGNKPVSPDHLLSVENKMYVAHEFKGAFEADKEICVDKLASISSSLYYKNGELIKAALQNIEFAKQQGFEKLFEQQKRTWESKWEESDIIIEGDISAQQGIRFNIFQLHQTYTGKDERMNIGPKGFTGEKYGGSTYWDTEAYCLPFYLSNDLPEVAKNLLLYRYKQLDKAIENAKKLGFKGGAALFPMVTMNGEECHNEWEITFEEIHRNGAIAYAIYNYIKYTGDDSYLNPFGIEVLIAISRFWAQRVNYSEDKKKYVMLGVTGPNEYENNINNNWYTSKMAEWTLQYTINSINELKNKNPKSLQSIFTKIQFNPEKEIKHWENILEHLYFPFDDIRKIFLQQDGFLDKELKPATEIPADERPINKHWSWDRILRSCYIKQADVLQGLFFLEDQFDTETIKRNFEFYEPLTVHESSLSASIHAIIAARIGNQDKAYEFYLTTSRLDLDDYNSDTEDGLHITSMGGTWMSIVYGFGGLRIVDNTLSFSPFLPKKWSKLEFKILYRGHKIHFEMTKSNINIGNIAENELKINVFQKEHLIKPQQTITITMQ